MSNDRHRGGTSGARLRFGWRATQQRWPGGGQRHPHLQHGTPVDKSVSGTGLMGHFPLHRASGRALCRLIAILQSAFGPGQGGRSLRPGTHVRPTASGRGDAPAAALTSFAGGRGIVNVFCPPRRLEPWSLLCGQAAPMRGQMVVPGLSRSIAHSLSLVNTGGNARLCRLVCMPIAWKTARLRVAQAAPDRSTAIIDTY